MGVSEEFGDVKILEGRMYVESVEDVLRRIRESGCNIVLIDARYVVDIDQVKFATEKALKAWKEGRRVAKSLPMEILLYCAGTRQIDDAVEIGLKEGLNELVAVVLDGKCVEKLKELGFREEKVLKMDDEKVRRVKEFYGISDSELEIVGIEKLSMLVRERIALFDVFKV